MLIGKPEILRRDGELVYRVSVDSPDSPDSLWFSVEEQFADLVSDSSDAALVALLMPAMARGEDIHLFGAVSERLYHNVSHHLQRVLQLVVPSLRRVAVHPTELRTGGERAPGVATAFSAGIDSFSTLADHLREEVAVGFRVTHLLFNNVGSHGHGERGGRLFHERYARIAPVVDRLGIPCVRTNSNMDSAYDQLTFRQTHTLRNAAVALLLQRGIGRWLYASTNSYHSASVAPSPDIARCDAIAVPLLATEDLDALSVGAEYTRVEKILRVAEIADSHQVLDVCVGSSRAGNCSECWKCVRTLVVLEIAGLLDRYEASFDLSAYRMRRNWYLGELLRADGPLEIEVVTFAREQGFSFPLSSRLRAWLKPFLKRPVRALRRIGRALRSRTD